MPLRCQGLRNSAFLEVTAHLRLQNQELLDLQASEQCVKEMTKTLAHHAHATYSDASTVHHVAASAHRPAKAQVRLLASQRRKKGTVKSQASHTPATNPDAPPLHLVDDSAWETVKEEARNSPATCIVFPTIHPAADSVWKNLKAESVPVRDTSDKVIIQGRTVGSHCSFFRGIPFGRCGYLSGHAK